MLLLIYTTGFGGLVAVRPGPEAVLQGVEPADPHPPRHCQLW
jgi:hypothetical protein